MRLRAVSRRKSGGASRNRLSLAVGLCIVLYIWIVSCYAQSEQSFSMSHPGRALARGLRTDHFFLIRTIRRAGTGNLWQNPFASLTLVAMNIGRNPSKIHVPHTEDEGCNIVGILEQLDPDCDTQGKPIALVLSRFSLDRLSGVGTKCIFVP